MIFNMLPCLLFYFARGGDSMFSQALIDVSVTLIIVGKRTFAQVPAVIQSDVKATLEALGLGTDGQPLQPVA